MNTIKIKELSIGPKTPLVVMCGPCVIESRDHCLHAAETLKQMFAKHSVHLIFKSSYDKANRTSYHSFRGPGLDEGLRILQEVQSSLDLPVVTDIHTIEEAAAAGEVCELLQIPAFLCRQTDLIVAAAKTGAVINVKKGQFLAPWDVGNIIQKIESAGNKQIIMVERGTSFGYNTLISDMRSIPIMQRYGYPVCFDATHSVMKPGGLGGVSGGEREFIPTLTRAALAAGANCLFIEAHPKPAEAKSDAASVMAFTDLDKLLPQFKAIYELVQQFSGDAG